MKVVATAILLLVLASQESLGQILFDGPTSSSSSSSSTKVGSKLSTTDTDTRAASTYQNCNCQCNSDTWTDGKYIRGNCRSQDRNGALFCYVSGSALCSCRDVQVSSFLKNNDGRFKYYSYEACTTPPRSKCSNYGIGNYGDGDFKYCSSNGGGFGGFGGGSGSFGGGNYGSGSYRPSNQNYRPNRPNYGNGGRPSYGGSRPSYGGSRPFGSSSNGPIRNSSPSLDDILNGVRRGTDSSSSSGSSGGGVNA